MIDLEVTGLNPAEHSVISAGSLQSIGGKIRLATAEHRYFLPTSLMAEVVSQSVHIDMITNQQSPITNQQSPINNVKDTANHCYTG